MKGASWNWGRTTNCSPATAITLASITSNFWKKSWSKFKLEAHGGAQTAGQMSGLPKCTTIPGRNLRERILIRLRQRDGRDPRELAEMDIDAHLDDQVLKEKYVNTMFDVLAPG